MMARILSIFGTRPEAVKMAPVVKCLAQTPGIESLVCVTSQHRQMLDQVLNIFNIQPDFDLDLMRPNQSLAEITARIFTELDPLLEKLKPDWILVQGDTTTVMAAAILGYYRRIRIGHVEAGLRTHDKWQPFPEEVNRRIAGVVADLHFAPTEHSRSNLLREGIPDEQIVVTGNPAVDALLSIVNRPMPLETRSLIDQWGDRKLILVTAHRRENFGKPLEDICSALRILALRYANQVEICYPLHLNPHVQATVRPILEGVPGITLLPPMDYLPMVHLLQHAALVLTDSGGIQEEATSLHKPTLVLREVTERPEGVEAGILKLVGTNVECIVAEAIALLDDPNAAQAIAHLPNPFGDGHAAEKIVAALLKTFSRKLSSE